MSTSTNTSDLTQGSIIGHIRTIAVPAMFGQFFGSLYNWIDTFWGGKISSDVLAAFSLTFPIYLFAIAVGQWFASGCMVLVSNALGAKKPEDAQYYLEQSAFIAFKVGIFFSVATIIISPYLLRFLGGAGAVLMYSKQYLNVLLWGMPFLVVGFVLNSGLISRGDTTFMRNIYVMNTLINLFLDPLLLYGLKIGGLTIIPAMGVYGIALATVLVQVLGMILTLGKLIKNKDIRVDSIKRYIPHFAAVKQIIVLGFPSFLQVSLAAVGLAVMNFFLVNSGGRDAIAAYGVGLRIEQMALIPSFGFGLALSALVGQNNGAKNYIRILKSYQIVRWMALLLLICVMLPLALLGSYMASIFTTDGRVIFITTRYLWFALLAFNGYQLMNLSQGLLQGMKKPKYPMFILIFRQLILPWITFPVFVFVLGWGIYGAFIAMLLGVWISAMIMRFFAYKTIRKIIAINTP